MRQSRLRRLARGSAAASIATFAALVSHVAAGGALPSLIGIAVPLVLSVTVCVLLAGRRLSLTRLAIAVLISQTMFHVLFVLGASRAVMETTPGHDHAAMLAGVLTVSSGGSSALIGGIGMWLGHAAAAVVTTAAIHRGERTLSAGVALITGVSAWLRARLRVFTATLPAPAVAPRVRAPRVIAPVIVPAPVRVLRHRGPPALVTI